MSDFGAVIVELLHIHRDNFETDEMTDILIELNDIATKRQRLKGSTDLNDAILDWANDNFSCGSAAKDGHEHSELEWA